MKDNRIKTTLVSYSIDTSDHTGLSAYFDVIQRAVSSTRLGGPCHVSDQRYQVMTREVKVAQDYVKRITGPELTRGVLEREAQLGTQHVYDAQWTAYLPEDDFEGGVVSHDWVEFRWANEKIKTGYFLVLTEEMREVRINTHGCGYCGKQEPASKGYVFCPHCIGSPYLKEDDLYLTRMRPAGTSSRQSREPLTQAEHDHLLPLYVQAQTKATTERASAAITKRLERTHKDYAAAIEKATVERDGMLWFLERGVNVENLIYYNHTKCFSWGWQKPVSVKVRDALLAIVSEFPFQYEIACDDGTTLRN